ncbi:hypothetical protein KAX75_02465 [candidate division WOR-3 bacterium]|nr:hypothetical protein [candidate division WOR-3 bacterium]
MTDKRVASLRGHRIDQADLGTVIEQFTEDDEMMHFSSYSSIKTNTGLREEDFNP